MVLNNRVHHFTRVSHATGKWTSQTQARTLTSLYLGLASQFQTDLDLLYLAFRRVSSSDLGVSHESSIGVGKSGLEGRRRRIKVTVSTRGHDSNS